MTSFKDFLNRRLSLEAWKVLFLAAAVLVIGGYAGILGVLAGAGILFGTAGGLYAEREEARKKKEKEAKADAGQAR